MVKLLKGQVALANKMILEEKISVFAEGNISAVDREAGVVVVKPSGVSLSDMTEEKTLVVSLADGRMLEGCYNPCSDIALYLAIYRKFPQINAIAHIYSQWTTVYSQSGKNIPILNEEQLIPFDNKILCTGMLHQNESAETESINKVVAEMMHYQEIRDKGALLIHHDGAIIWETTTLRLLEYAKKLEQAAKLAWHTEILHGSSGETSVLLAGHIGSNTPLMDQESSSFGIPGNQVTVDEERKISLELLTYFDQVCRENNIKYSLTGGTLLGAVRHGGFIPWDDDVDVFLTRPEYEKLEDVFDDKKRFVFVNRNKDPNFNYVFGRLVDTKTLIVESPNTVSSGKGIFLDICIVDGLPNNPIRRKLHIAYMRILVRARRATIHNPSGKSYRRRGPIFLLLKKLLRKFTSYQFWNRRIMKVMKKYAFESSEFVGNFTSQYGRRELLHKNVFASYIDVPFENYKFMICEGYDEYLTNIYGSNYMVFPPKSKRKGHHPNKAFWIS